ncbi:hypothetical protein ACO2FN_08750 [Staphylococcus epidermidis]
MELKKLQQDKNTTNQAIGNLNHLNQPQKRCAYTSY